MTQPDITELAEGAYCPGCGYDLRGSAGDRCPECGLAVDRSVRAQVAWERRADLGRSLAFRRTAWLATIHPGRLARIAAGQVDVTAARRFRWTVLGVVTAVITLAFGAVVWHEGGPAQLSIVPDPQTSPTVPAPGGLPLLWSAGATLAPVLPIGLLLALRIGTHLDHWFVLGGRSAVQRNRAMAATRYTAAPLLGLAGVAVIAAVRIVVGTDNSGTAAQAELAALLVLTGVPAAAAIVLLTWTGPARYALALPGGGAGRAAVVLAGTAVQWGVAVVIGLGLFPAVVGLVWLMIDSLR